MILILYTGLHVSISDMNGSLYVQVCVVLLVCGDSDPNEWFGCSGVLQYTVQLTVMFLQVYNLYLLQSLSRVNCHALFLLCTLHTALLIIIICVK